MPDGVQSAVPSGAVATCDHGPFGSPAARCGSTTALLRCEALSWVDRDWPGWIRVRLVDASGREWFFVDKVPIFGANLTPGEDGFPLPVSIRCDVLDTVGQVLVVSTKRDHVEAEDGTSQFRVDRAQVQQPQT